MWLQDARRCSSREVAWEVGAAERDQLASCLCAPLYHPICALIVTYIFTSLISATCHTLLLAPSRLQLRQVRCASCH